MIDYSKNITGLSFEEAYKRLTETAGKLERGGLPLEESLALFEEGVQLSHYCEEVLAKAELKVSQLAPTSVVTASKSYVFSTDDDNDEEITDGDGDEEDEEEWSDEAFGEALNDFKF